MLWSYKRPIFFILNIIVICKKTKITRTWTLAQSFYGYKSAQNSTRPIQSWIGWFYSFLCKFQGNTMYKWQFKKQKTYLNPWNFALKHLFKSILNFNCGFTLINDLEYSKLFFNRCFFHDDIIPVSGTKIFVDEDFSFEGYRCPHWDIILGGNGQITFFTL